MAQLAELAAAVQSYQAGDLDAAAHVQQLLLAAVSHQPSDAEFCESLLTSLVESFAAAGDNGKELLDQLLLDVLPQLAPFAVLSQGCCQALSALCGLAAAAASPRDTVTAYLEVMDQLMTMHSLNAPVLQFLCGLMDLLPAQLVKLARRKAAFAAECLVPVAALAKAHGKMLQGWAVAQLRLAARQASSSITAATGASCNKEVAAGAAGDTMQRLDTFLAANWQMYEQFAGEVLHKVLPQESDAAAAASCKRAVGNLLLCLLLHLTASWLPTPLADLASEVLSAPGAASRLPSPASVIAPEPFTFVGKQAATTATAAAARPKTAAGTAASSSTAGQLGQNSSSGGEMNDASGAAGVVCSMLKLLKETEFDSWQSLAGTTGNEAAGAALAALYASCMDATGRTGSDLFAMPELSVETLQVACGWCDALSAAIEGNPLVILKVIALLQRAAAPAAAHAAAAAAASTPSPTASQADAAAAQQLLPHLEPCISLLASTIASGVGVALRSQASLALQQLLRAPGPGVSYSCLQELLGSSSSSAGSRRVHPEVAALLMQEVRLQLARTQGRGPFSSAGSVQLVLPWLQQHSAVGWRDADQLSENANAVCTALAVVRLALLKAQPAGATAAAGCSNTGSTTAGNDASSASPSAGNSSNAEGASLRVMLQQPLQALSTAVTDALQGLQLANTVEQRDAASNTAPAAAAAAAAGDGSSGRQQQRVRIPGDAQGAGHAVDAWLAVSRVQDVLDRVLELL